MSLIGLPVDDAINCLVDYATYGFCITEIEEGKRQYFDIRQLYGKELSNAHTEKVSVDMLLNCTLKEILEAVHEKRS